MSAYEFRFINERGATFLHYFTSCKGDDDALARVTIASDLNYARFEIWQDDRQVSAGRASLM